MAEPVTTLRLCRLDALADPGSRGFTLRTTQGLQDIFIVRRAAAVYGYCNRCPHTGSPLDWLPDQFLNLDRDLIQCATHAAQFRIEDGYCVTGPCAGQSLEPFEVEVREGWIWVQAVVLL